MFELLRFPGTHGFGQYLRPWLSRVLDRVASHYKQGVTLAALIEPLDLPRSYAVCLGEDPSEMSSVVRFKCGFAFA